MGNQSQSRKNSRQSAKARGQRVRQMYGARNNKSKGKSDREQQQCQRCIKGSTCHKAHLPSCRESEAYKNNKKANSKERAKFKRFFIPNEVSAIDKEQEYVVCQQKTVTGELSRQQKQSTTAPHITLKLGQNLNWSRIMPQ
jgi:hypothetical protein